MTLPRYLTKKHSIYLLETNMIFIFFFFFRKSLGSEIHPLQRTSEPRGVRVRYLPLFSSLVTVGHLVCKLRHFGWILGSSCWGSLCWGKQKIWKLTDLGGGNSNIFYVHPYLGKWSNLTNIFQMGWNHQPEIDKFFPKKEFFGKDHFGNCPNKIISEFLRLDTLLRTWWFKVKWPFWDGEWKGDPRTQWL